MKIIVTGSLGNISGRLAEQLAQKGHDVTVISHNQDKKAAIEAIGAKPAIGSLSDYEFLLGAFQGADAIYLMTPPNYQTDNLKEAMIAIVENYAKVIEAVKVKYIVNLSGIGAQSPQGYGPSSAFYYTEAMLNELPETNVLHLRPGMFYSNYYGSAAMIKHMGFIGNNFESDKVIVMTHPHDIADAAVEAFETLSFSGKQIRYVASDELTGAQIVDTIGSAISKPDLHWVVFSDEELIQGIMRNGFSHHMASNFAEMGTAIKEGKIWEQYLENKGNAYGKIKFADFAKTELAPFYKTL
ncbi:NmrA family NAD(P)-binding protein [Flavobacterium cerinum]|uniref:NAD-dependent epimerase/dehydratase family protein n=1 Tax=Flavobacterium cerinum TaxID=2502784 RepID=A0A3S3U1K6_9FLAO|nr:NmrA family NAD(P)-binding protein [Flavobacterium cerinum]RWX01560.1 NAD-dependent epimerase/dehydratase family protein [Flavobacterium cerinum]